MTKRNKDDRNSAGTTDVLEVTRQENESDGKALARVTLDPLARNASVANAFGSQVFGGSGLSSITDATAVLAEQVSTAADGDMKLASRILAAQAVALDTLFTEMARRSGKNMGEYPEAAERYMRLALRSQTNCRTTLEALAKIHQPREQTVKHVHVNEGGQAVVADQFHNHTGGIENVKTDEQCHATGAAGKGAPLLSQDPGRDGVPITSREGEAALQDARREQSRRAKR